MNTCDSNNFATSKTIRCVLNYMLLEHFINYKRYLSFQDIVLGTGLSPKTIRRVLKILKELNIVRTVFDLTNNRRTLYTLVPGKAWQMPKPDDVKSGLYVIDIGLGLPKYLNLKSLRILRSADYVLYSPNVPSRIIELVSTDNVDNISKLSQYEVKRFLNVQPSSIKAILIDRILDAEIVDLIFRMIEYKENVFYVSNVSPIHIALNMIDMPYRKRIRFKRDSNIELIIACNLSDIDVNSIIKLLKVHRECNSINIHDIDISEIQNSRCVDNDSVYVAYIRT